MAYDDAFSIYQAVLASTPNVVLDGLTAVEVDPGTGRAHRRGAGRRYPTVATEIASRRAATFSTISIDTLLAVAGIFSGTIKVASGATYTGLSLYEAKYDDLGHFASGSVHVQNLFSRAMLWLTALRASQDIDGMIVPAVADLAVLPVSDGTNDPLTRNTAQALPAATAETSYYCLGPVLINGTAMTRVAGWALTQACQVQTDSSSGSRWPRTAHERATSHMLGIDFRTPVPLTDFGLGGAAISATIVLYLTKCAATAERVAAATEEHIKLTINHGTITPRRAAGSLGGDIASGVEINVLHDGTNLPIVVDTTSALPS